MRSISQLRNPASDVFCSPNPSGTPSSPHSSCNGWDAPIPVRANHCHPARTGQLQGSAVAFQNASRPFRTGYPSPFVLRSLTALLILFAFFRPLTTPLCAQQAPPAPAAHFTVFIDAAHGGGDSGAHINDSTLEKNITLALSVRLRSLLSARGIDVATSRESDKDLDANRRAELANRASASACIVLHATASGIGVHLFLSSLTPAQAVRLAAWKAAQAPFIRQSASLAASVNSVLQQAGIPVTLARTSLPGLDSMTCPAIAVELATPAAEEGKSAPALSDAEYQAHLADLLATALITWRAEAHRP